MGQADSKRLATGRFVNAPEDASLDALHGYLLLSPVRLAVVRDFPALKVIVRADWKKERVAIVACGGFGHEPADIEYIGQGMLTGIAAGTAWRAPTTDEIAQALLAVCGPSGCLLIIKNYIASRLNVQLAMEKVAKLGLKVKLVNVKDDVVSMHDNLDRSSARGIAGVSLVVKIAGAAADAGRSLDEVYTEAEDAAQATSSIGVAYSRGSIAHHSVTTAHADTPEGLMEVGIGVHGEPGWMRVPATAVAADIVDMMVAKLKPFLPESGSLCVMLNNLGTVPPMEMAILAKQVMDSAIAPRISLFAGPAPYYTALNTNGFSLSVMALNELREERLLAATECKRWFTPVRPLRSFDEVPKVVAPEVPQDVRREAVASDHPVVRHLLTEVVQALVDAQEELASLSAKTGTGKLGQTVARFAKSVGNRLDELPLACPGLLFQELSRLCAMEAGVLFSLSKIILATAAEELRDQEGWNFEVVIGALIKGTAEVQKLAEVELNRRTFLDALVPALAVPLDTEDASSDFSHMQWRLRAAGQARRGARATAHMIHASDWAAYTPLATRAGIPDGGAVAIATMFTALETPIGGSFKVLPTTPTPLAEDGDEEKAEKRARQELHDYIKMSAPLESTGTGKFRRVRMGTVLHGPMEGRDVAVSEMLHKDIEQLKMTRIRDGLIMDRLRMKNWLFRPKPNIAEVYEIIVTPQSCFYVTERLKGRSLMEEIETREQLTYLRIAELLRQVLSAVRSLHESRLIHRDLKPENFRFDSSDVSSGVLKLTDICGMIIHLSQSYENEFGKGVVCGTLAYMSPEALQGCGRQAADMWSVGVMLHLMLAGTLPFKASSIEEMRAGHQQPENVLQGETRDRWQVVPAEARDLVQRLLERNARNRITVHEALEHSFVRMATAEGANADSAAPTHNADRAVLSPTAGGAYSCCPTSRISAFNWNRDCSSPEGKRSVTKTIYLVRHGEAVHNIEEKRAKRAAAEKALKSGIQRGTAAFDELVEAARKSVLHNPDFYDATLSHAGKLDAARCTCELRGLHERGLPLPTVVFTSPLQRTLQTAAEMFPYHSSVHALEELRERRTGLPCDSRNRASTMCNRPSFHQIDFNKIKDSDEEDCKEEAKAELRKRCAKFLRDLPSIKAPDESKDDRDHAAICVVTHKGFLRELERGPLGHPEATEFMNCEVRVYEVTWTPEGELEVPAKCLYSNASLCTLEMRNFPAAWITPSAVAELPRKLEAMLAEFGELREKPEVVERPDGLRVNAAFTEQNAAAAAAVRLHGLDIRSQEEKRARPVPYESERLWARISYDTAEL
eukprot:TRINITY_DN1690_c0_g1_i5.p1 TRINITY_DN1690_c0_g1~~TRINITY_DN1690_c0_g1_i5.p1  ORF type:complete len:1307 (-),score=310.58 TRINITY_DN1690_c0_g1_i5:3-3923(-)